MSSYEFASIFTSFEKASRMGLTVLVLSIAICLTWKRASENLETVRVPMT